MKTNNPNKIVFYSWISIFLVGLFFLYYIGVIRTTNKEFVCSRDGKNCVTVIQYHNIPKLFLYEMLDKQSNFDPNEYSGIYIIPGKFRGYLPKKNFIYVDYGEARHYIKWENDTTYIILPYIVVKENNLDAKSIYMKDFSEKKSFDNEKEFYNYIEKEYISFSKYDLKSWVGF